MTILLEEGELRRLYMLSLLRSRRAIDRILASVADLAERDPECARTLSAHPEALAAIHQCLYPKTSGKFPKVHAAKRRGKRTKPHLASKVRIETALRQR